MTAVNRRDALRYISAAAALNTTALSTLAAAATTATARTSDPVQLDALVVRRFAAKVAGRVIAPDAGDYESARQVFNRAFDKHPAMVVRCANANDVARSLEFAQLHQLPIAVRGGGHNRAGFSTCDGGIVIDLSGMGRIEVNQDKRTAVAQAGALTVQLDAQSQRVGLATTLAGCPTVGIAGLTLGGGEGFLMSKFGAACDNLLSAELVTVDGRMLKASEDSDPDLFWAIRGGGGNFGVATSLQYRLHPVADVLAGRLEFSSGRLPEMLQALARFVESAPDEMNVIAQVFPSPRGVQFRMLFCHCGDPRRGGELLEPLRALKPGVDDFQVMPYLQANATLNRAAPAAHFQTNLFLPILSDAVIAAMSEVIDSAPADSRIFIVPFYGAITRVPPATTAFSLRSMGYELDIMGRWNESSAKAAAVQWVNTARDKLQAFATGTYVNQLGETSEELVRAAYKDNYDRLRTLKKRFDPANILRSNQNINPA